MKKKKQKDLHEGYQAVLTYGSYTTKSKIYSTIEELNANILDTEVRIEHPSHCETVFVEYQLTRKQIFKFTLVSDELIPNHPKKDDSKKKSVKEEAEELLKD